MKVAKIKNNKTKEEKVVQEQYSIKQMIIISIILVVIFCLFYFITTLVVKPVDNNNQQQTQIDDNLITINQLLDRKENEYYVLATKNSMYPTSVNYDEIYNNYIKKYSSKEKTLTVYKVNLDDALNKNYIGEELKIKEDLSDMVLNNEVLFKIKEGKIEKYYVGNSEIIEKLSKI